MMLTGLPLFANVNRVAQTLRVLNKDGVGKTSFGCVDVREEGIEHNHNPTPSQDQLNYP
ncbi:hypothetical protein C6341_g27570 [Phytophthora cactorum]|nr:hypothetical protein C6341_g27570 [Phytophthora cactorum]